MCARGGKGRTVTHVSGGAPARAQREGDVPRITPAAQRQQYPPVSGKAPLDGISEQHDQRVDHPVSRR